MSLITKRYLVATEISAPVLERHKNIEREFVKDVKMLNMEGGAASDFANKNQELINRFNSSVDGLFTNFVKESGIAQGLDSRDTDKPTFDNYFKWGINCLVKGSRLILEARAATEDDFPIKNTPACLREISMDQFLVLSGGEA